MNFKTKRQPDGSYVLFVEGRLVAKGLSWDELIEALRPLDTNKNPNNRRRTFNGDMEF